LTYNKNDVFKSSGVEVSLIKFAVVFNYSALICGFKAHILCK